MAGGVGEGAIPLSIGYASITQQAQGDLFAQVLPPVMLGSLTAIAAGGHAQLRRQALPAPDRRGPAAARRARRGRSAAGRGSAYGGTLDVAAIGAARVTAVTLYLIGVMAQRLFGWPAPVTMLFLAVILKLARAVSPELRAGAYRRLQLLLDRGDLSAAVRDRRGADAVGQADGGLHRCPT